MKKLTILVTIVLVLFSCNGRKSGPLAKEEYYSADKPKEMGQGMGQQSTGTKVAAEKANVSVVPCEGCIKIADLLAGKKDYEGKTIKIKGSVTKFNPEIMGKNWIHIQDGTEFEGAFDLTITTDKVVAVGDIVTFEGKIILNKDFGYGYFYNILMEDGQPVK
jgi:hypothetical protein